MEATCSVKTLIPLLTVLEARGSDLDLVPATMRSLDSGARVSVDAVHAIFARAAERFGDAQLGLKLGRILRFGELGPFDYAVRSAPTIRESVDVASRYCRLHSDSFSVGFETWRQHAMIQLSNGKPWTRPAGDFAMSAAFKIHVSDRAPFTKDLECWFPYCAPDDMAEYERAFPGAILKFDAPTLGFAFDRDFQAAPMPGADPLVHSIQRDRLEALLLEASGRARVKSRARDLIQQQLQRGENPELTALARELRMSPRTLCRRLEEEGTSFADVRDDARQALALAFVRESERPLAEVAFLLGYAHVESFHRAFKRWTGATPLAYRAGAPRQRPD